MMELRLLSYDGANGTAPKAVTIGPEGCSFGRGPDNTLSLADPERLISRNQARIEASGGSYTLTNVSSANTILFNDREIGPGEQTAISEGDEIRVGRFLLGIFAVGGLPIDHRPAPPSPPIGVAAPPPPPPLESLGSLDPLASFGIGVDSSADPFADLLGPSVRPMADPVSVPPSPSAPMPRPAASPAQAPKPVPEPAPAVAPVPVPVSGIDLFAGLDAPGSRSLPVDLGMADLAGGGDKDAWASNTKPVDSFPAFTPQNIIPDDFNPFDLPSLAPRNAEDPFASLQATHITGLEDLMKSQDRGPENLLDDLPKPSAEPLADTRAMTGNSLLGGIGQDDPLALFSEESPFSMLDAQMADVSNMRDNTAEIASAFQMPSIARETPTAEPAPPVAKPIAASPIPADPMPAGLVPIPAAKAEVTPARPIPPAAPVVTPQPVAASTPAATDALMAAFFAGAGMADPPKQPLTPEFMHLLGELLAISAQGTVDLMQARAATKHELRAQVTMIAPQANNPLKFAPDGQAAMAQLVGKRFAGFMQPADAMRDAFNDLRAHQVGMTAGMRAALLEVLLRFAPDRLEQRMTQHSLLDTVMPSGRKSRLWDLYTDMYQQIKNEAADEFHALCGDAFLKSYDEEVQRLAKRGRE
jgi:FHA domain-containing protein